MFLTNALSLTEEVKKLCATHFSNIFFLDWGSAPLDVESQFSESPKTVGGAIRKIGCHFFGDVKHSNEMIMALLNEM